MSDPSRFAFTRLPTDIQIVVMNQLPRETLMNFRHACTYFFHLTDDFMHSTEVSTESRMVMYRSNDTHFKKFRDWITYDQVPRSIFWNKCKFYRMILFVAELHEQDMVNFIEEHKKNPINFFRVQLVYVPISLTSDILNHFKNVEETTLLCSSFFTDLFLCSDDMKLLNNDAWIYGYNLLTGEYKTTIDAEDVPVTGINHVTRKWIEGIYVFKSMHLGPISINTKIVDLLKDVNYMSVYDPQHHDSTMLKDFDLQKLKEKNKHARCCVAVKHENSEEYGLISFTDDEVIMKKYAAGQLLQHTLKDVFRMDMVENIQSKLTF